MMQAQTPAPRTGYWGTSVAEPAGMDLVKPARTAHRKDALASVEQAGLCGGGDRDGVADDHAVTLVTHPGGRVRGRV